MRSFSNTLVSVLRRLVATPTKLSLVGWEKSQHDAIRFSMYEYLEKQVSGLISPESTVSLAVSGSGYLAKLVAPQVKVVHADYPEFNVLSLPYNDNTFDLVVTDQVLEHVCGDPFKAVEECRRVLKPGGIAIHTTPFLFQIHGYPSDYWRFTPDALALMCEAHSEILMKGSWGNRYLWMLNWAGVLFDQHVPLAKWHPYHRISVINETAFPVVCWVVARK
jgi:SAM-dependent methyltransferase